uniref:GATA zinc finger domain-containing protein 14-like n=1 Tax=Dermatophagoides pteronyssinus TaxID=6956 RepID=A0A6P6Y2B6_DERPT|nr:GATA zinc finger domain-containing protein 14-like [Dermatophagoides pteronyssinus]
MATSSANTKSLTNHVEDATRTLWDEPLAPIPDEIPIRQNLDEISNIIDEIDNVVEIDDQKNNQNKKDANNNNNNNNININTNHNNDNNNNGLHHNESNINDNIDIQHHDRLHDSRKIANQQILSINSGPMSEGLLKVATPSSLQDTAKTICYFMSCLLIIGFIFIIIGTLLYMEKQSDYMFVATVSLISGIISLGSSIVYFVAYFITKCSKRIDESEQKRYKANQLQSSSSTTTVNLTISNKFAFLNVDDLEQQITPTTKMTHTEEDKNMSKLITKDELHQTPNQTKNQFDANWRRSNSSISNGGGNRSRSRNLLDTFTFRSPSQFPSFSNGLHSHTANVQHNSQQTRRSSLDIGLNNSSSSTTAIDDLDDSNIIVINSGVKKSLTNGMSKNGSKNSFEQPFVIVQFNKNPSTKLVA